MPEVTYLEALRQGLWEEMERDERVFILGEDVGLYGGAFKVTEGFTKRFGEQRVIDTPISEAAIVGAAAGAAHMGMRPVAEMQFIDFISCAYDMLTNYVATARYRAGLATPIVVRGPCGGYVRGGPFHSQNPEAAFFHTPGLKIVYPATARDAKGLIKASIRDDDPVLYLEHKWLYRRIKEQLPEGEEIVTPIGEARLAREGKDLSIVTYGATVWKSLEAADRLEKEDGVAAEVLDLRTLLPMDDAVLMPQMGESIAEGTVSKWLKKLGDPVKRDEPLFEISTDKVDAEIPSPTAGVLAEIKVQEGQTVPVQTLVAVIETDKSATLQPVAAAPAPAKAAPPPPASSPVIPRPAPSPPVAAPKGDGTETAEDRLRRRSTPLVRKIAAEHAVDISTIPGTGFAGRVTKQDILRVIERAPEPTVSGSRVPGPAVIQHPSVEPWPGDRVEPFSKIRKITADHMIMSRRTSAHVTSFFEVDYSRVAELRRKHKAAYAERGVNLTYLAFIAKACAEQLRAHPVVNAAVSGDNIIYRRDVNIRIADGADADRFLADVKRTLEDFPEGAI